MISQIIAKNDERQWDSLPGGCLFFALKSEQDYLYIGSSFRLSARLRGIWNHAREDKQYQELCERATLLE